MVPRNSSRRGTAIFYRFFRSRMFSFILGGALIIGVCAHCCIVIFFSPWAFASRRVHPGRGITRLTGRTGRARCMDQVRGTSHPDQPLMRDAVHSRRRICVCTYCSRRPTYSRKRCPAACGGSCMLMRLLTLTPSWQREL